MTEREALKMALEALERGETELRWQAITAIKEALAQPEQEPVRMNDGRLTRYHDGSIGIGTPSHLKPLTDEQKVALCKQFPDHLTFNAIHAIEAAHGIKE